MVTKKAYELIVLLCKKGPLSIAEIVKQSKLTEIDVQVAHQMFPGYILKNEKEETYDAADVAKKTIQKKPN